MPLISHSHSRKFLGSDWKFYRRLSHGACGVPVNARVHPLICLANKVFNQGHWTNPGKIHFSTKRACPAPRFSRGTRYVAEETRTIELFSLALVFWRRLRISPRTTKLYQGKSALPPVVTSLWTTTTGYDAYTSIQYRPFPPSYIQQRVHSLGIE